MKKSIPVLIVVCFLIFGFMLSDASTVLENPVSRYKWTDVQYSYEGTSSSQKIQSYFTYNDGYFLNDATELNGEIAKMSVALAASAYDIDTVISVLGFKRSWNKQTLKWEYEKTNRNMAFDEIDFDVLETTYYRNLTLTDNDYVAYTIAKKKIGDKTVYCVPIRGTAANAEWFSDFNLGKTDDHLGFLSAANVLYADLIRVYYNDVKAGLNKNDAVFLFTGHSRGAAVANILTKRFTVEKMAPAKQIFGYTFACPAVSKNTDKKLNNLYNFNNPGDLITLLPLEEWGYSRNGQDIDVYHFSSMPVRDNVYEQFKRLSGKTCLSEDTPVDYLSHIRVFIGSREKFLRWDYQVVFKLIAEGLGGHNDVSWIKFLLYYKTELTIVLGVVITEALIESLKLTNISALFNYCSGLDVVYKDLIGFIETNEEALKVMTSEEYSDFYKKNKESIDQIALYTNTRIASAEQLLACKASLNEFLASLSEQFPIFFDIVKMFFDLNGDPKGAIFHGHTPLFYVVLVNALFFGYEGWTEYKGSEKLNFSFENYKARINTIGERCFKSSSILDNVVFSDDIYIIRQYAFSSSSISGKVVIPPNVSKIEFQTFYACALAEEFVIPDNVTYIDDQAFAFCDGLKSLTIPCHITYSAAESGTQFRETHHIEHVKITGSGKFGDYTDKTSLYTPWRLSWATNLTVELSENINEIGDYVFEGCNNLYSINIPDSVTRIGKCAFDGCSKWQDELKLPAGLTVIGEQAFSSCNKLNGDLIIPQNVTSIGRCAFNQCYALKGKLEIPSGVSSIYDTSFYGCSIDELVIPESVNYIGSKAFCCCEKLKSVIISNSVALESSAFDYCTAVEYVEVTGSGKLKGSYRPWFASKANNLKVVIDNGITEISEKAFNGCIYLYEISLPDSVTCICDSAFEDCKNLHNIKIPAAVTSIGKSAFEDCEKLSGSLVLPKGLLEIGELAFNNCKSLNGQLVIPQSVISIGRGAFYYCSGLSGTLELPDSITSLPEIVFYSTGFEEVIIPSSVKSIGVKAFYSSNKLKKVTMPASTSIQNTAFEYCTNLKTVNLTGSGEMKYWGSSPWYFTTSEYTYLTTAIIDNGVTTISANAFRRCGHLSQITIPKTVTSIGDSAFYNCSSLQDVYFNGTKAEWNNITIGSSNEYLKRATIHCTDTEYKITIEKTSNGTVSASKVLAYAGDKIELIVTPDEGYKLDSIKVVDTKKNEIALENNSFLMPIYNVKITATFVKEDYTITVSDCENGTATVSKDVANFGDEITVTVTPGVCYELDTIKVNGETITGTTFTMPAKNVTVDVAFKVKSHNLTPVAGKAVTCTEDGYEPYYKCSDCGKLFSDAEGKNEISEPVVIAKLGHKLKEVPEVPPTKTEPGNYKYYFCERCGKYFSDPDGKTEIELSDTYIPVMTHNLTHIKKKDATCTESGNTAYYVCKDADCSCGKVYSDKYGQHEIKLEDTVIPAKGHSIKAVDEKKATCTEDGYASHFECSTCHKKFSDSEGKTEIDSPEVYPKLGHSWDEGEVTTQPGCETEGVKTFHCTREGCKSTKEEPISALGHDMEHLKHVKAKAETYDDDGNVEHYICERCGKKFADPDCKTVLSDAEIVIPKKGAPGLGDLVEIGNFKYQVTNPSTDGTGTLTFKGVITRVASVSIPATVTIKESSYIVNRIGTKAFYGDKTLKSVYIGNNVVIIDSYAFYGCSNLVKVSGGKVLKTIGTKAFAYCSKLKSFSITSSVLNKIGSYAFQKDKKLKTVYIRYTTKLTKSGVKKSLKSSSVKTVKVKKSKVKKYKKYFTKKNCGRKVKVKK